MFAGRQLEVEALLSECGVSDDSQLYVLMRLLGGAKKRKKKVMAARDQKKEEWKRACCRGVVRAGCSRPEWLICCFCAVRPVHRAVSYPRHCPHLLSVLTAGVHQAEEAEAQAQED